MTNHGNSVVKYYERMSLCYLNTINQENVLIIMIFSVWFVKRGIPEDIKFVQESLDIKFYTIDSKSIISKISNFFSIIRKFEINYQTKNTTEDNSKDTAKEKTF